MSARCIIATMKDEGPFILEWVAYHRLIGFDTIIVFSNDCSDGSDALLDALAEAGMVRHFDNSATPPDLPADPQNRAYRRAFAMPEVRQAEWLLVIDADEFFVIHPGQGRLDDLLEALPPDTGAVSAGWRIFGSAGNTRFADRPVIAQFDRAAPRDLRITPNQLAVKTLFRPEKFERLGVHRPFLQAPWREPDARIGWLNGSGADVSDHFRTRHWAFSPANAGYDLCQVNHYMIKSSEVFLMKRLRGTANSSNADRINFDYLDRYDANHETDRSLQRWVAPVEAEIARIRRSHPGIARLHDATVAGYRSRIGAAVADVAAHNPDIHHRLFDPAMVGARIAQQEKFLARTRRQTAGTRPAAANGASGPPGTAQPAAIRSNRPPPPAQGTEAPEWLRDLRQSDFRRGFFHSDLDFGAVMVERDPQQLVISFDNLSNVHDNAASRLPWGYGFVKKRGWSHLGIMSYRPNWFRDPALFAFLQRNRDAGLFARFPRVTLMGTSMGGYGAAAFCSLVPGATVLALSPQSTLDTGLVPWETRFAAGRRQDWSGPFGDAAAEAASAGRVYLLYDPLYAPDLRHARRFAGPHVVHLRARHSGHKSALFLRRAGLLSQVSQAAIEGTLTAEGFYRLYRAGRRLPWFQTALASCAMARQRPSMARRVLGQMRADGRAPMAAALAQRFGLETGG